MKKICLFITILILHTSSHLTPTFRYAKITAGSAATIAFIKSFCLNDQQRNNLESFKNKAFRASRKIIYQMATTNHFMAAVESYPRFSQEFQKRLFPK